MLSKKIGLPVRTDLKLAIRGGPRIVEMYPPKLPDLFQGDQLQIAGRFEGHGPSKITLKGRSGDEGFSESFQAEFPEVATDYNFVAPIWARRKVGYLLDQIRLHGESAEVKKELLRIAHDYTIATPYTSLLVVPESAKSSIATLRLRVLGQAYFRLLAEHPELSEIFALGNRITWVSPSGTAVVIDKQGQDEVAVTVLSSLFAPAK